MCAGVHHHRVDYVIIHTGTGNTMFRIHVLVAATCTHNQNPRADITIYAGAGLYLYLRRWRKCTGATGDFGA